MPGVRLFRNWIPLQHHDQSGNRPSISNTDDELEGHSSVSEMNDGSRIDNEREDAFGEPDLAVNAFIRSFELRNRKSIHAGSDIIWRDSRN